jgi:crotonobetainyl-CoA:carnitine CoA-transferase CaiB-like acyl-CoA transferase
MTMANQPLAGVRILDLTQALAGPFATMILADLGAEVIKIEPPGGDLTRSTPPHMVEGTSLYFVTNNRNKRGVMLDLKKPAALRAFHDLCRHADVVIYNFSEGVAERLKIDAATLRAIKPELIVCNMTGYGRQGPDARRKAVDPIIQSLSGAVSITGHPGTEPVRAGIPTADLSTGLYAAIGVLAALQGRSRTGEGASVEASLFHSQLSLLNYIGTYCIRSGEVPGPVGSGHPGTVPSQVFETSDGWVTIDAGFDRHFQNLCNILNQPELATDPRFINRAARARTRHELLPTLKEAIRRHTTDHWIATLDAAGIPCGKVNNVQEALDSPQSREYHAVRETSYRGQKVEVLTTPLWFDGEIDHPMLPPPTLGQHTQDVLRELLGYDDDALAALTTPMETEPLPAD